MAFRTSSEARFEALIVLEPFFHVLSPIAGVNLENGIRLEKRWDCSKTGEFPKIPECPLFHSARLSYVGGTKFQISSNAKSSPKAPFPPSLMSGGDDSVGMRLRGPI